ncbi:hypothetical protein F4780DRAFT_782390 [Xylariomycetidae sp. FL0641]|nr:hypothetical protein F4780DRAFT_782390 [Xylariomycetidae sp. FL0641]
MRLLNTATLDIHEFPEGRRPEYGILSHPWGDEEVDIREMQSPDHAFKASLKSASVAAKMSWAASRQTTREEDKAYSLLGTGIFGVNMPLLYGEGKRAFHRLQIEIMKVAEDYTILAWGLIRPWPLYPKTITLGAEKMFLRLQKTS